MNMQDMLKQSGALDSIAQELGIDRQSAQSGASALLPALLGGFRKQAQMDASGGGSRRMSGEDGDAATATAATPLRNSAFLALLLFLGRDWWGWWLWVGLILLIGRGSIRHPSVFDPRPPVTGPRRLLGWACIVIFVLTFSPLPLQA